MTKEEILEGNRLIVKFLDIKESKLHYDSYGIPTPTYKVLHKLYSGSSYNIPNKSLEVFIENCKYHSSWDWLMPCVEKIEHLGEDTFSLGRIEINSHHCRISSLCKNQPYIIVGCYKESPEKVKTNSKIEAVYLAVITFIKWYNEKCSE